MRIDEMKLKPKNLTIEGHGSMVLLVHEANAVAKIIYGRGCLIETYKQALCVAKKLSKAFNDSQKRK